MSEDHEAEFTLGSGVVKSASNDHLLAFKAGVDALNLGEYFGVSNFWVSLRSHQFSFTEEMSARIILVLLPITSSGGNLVLSSSESLGLLITSGILLLNLLLCWHVSQCDFFISENLESWCLNLEIVGICHRHGVRPQSAVEVDLLVLAKTSVNEDWDVEELTKWWDGSWEAASDLKHLLWRGKSNAFTLDDLLELL